MWGFDVGRRCELHDDVTFLRFGNLKTLLEGPFSVGLDHHRVLAGVDLDALRYRLYEFAIQHHLGTRRVPGESNRDSRHMRFERDESSVRPAREIIIPRCVSVGPSRRVRFLGARESP
jgi:hypothetical protein